MKKVYFYTAMLLLTLNNSYSQAAAAEVTEIESDDELPSVGVRYYYYPNLDAYFDTRSNLYLFEQKGVWTKSKDLASGLRGYSILNGVRVPITDYNGDTPQSKLEDHRKQFPKKYSSKRLPPKVYKEQTISEK